MARKDGQRIRAKSDTGKLPQLRLGAEIPYSEQIKSVQAFGIKVRSQSYRLRG